MAEVEASPAPTAGLAESENSVAGMEQITTVMETVRVADNKKWTITTERGQPTVILDPDPHQAIKPMDRLTAMFT
jgi:hypothetical protein